MWLDEEARLAELLEDGIGGVCDIESIVIVDGLRWSSN